MNTNPKLKLYRYPLYNLASNLLALILDLFILIWLCIFLVTKINHTIELTIDVLFAILLLVLSGAAFRDALIFPCDIVITKKGFMTRSPLFSFRLKEIPWDDVIEITSTKDSYFPARNGMLLKIHPKHISNTFTYLLTLHKYRGILINSEYEDYPELCEIIQSKVSLESR